MSGEVESYTAVLARVDARLDTLAQTQEARLTRIEDKLDSKFSVIDSKQDATTSRLDRLEGKLEGGLGMVKWLGPTGVAALIFGVLKASGLL